VDHGVRPSAPPPPGTKVLTLKWIYKVKKDRIGTVVRNKCRLVAQGFFHLFGEDYDQTYSSVAKFTSVQTIHALSAQLVLTVRHMDFDTAFLSASIEKNIWVHLPKGSRPAGKEDDGVYKLKKSFYGLKQAPREWNKCINEFLVSIGCTNTEADPCIYKRTDNGLNNKDQYTIIALCVDDLIIATSVKDNYKKLESEFQTRFSTKIMGTIKHIFGMDVHYDLQNRAIHVSQSQYIKQSVKAYNKYEPSGKLKPYSTPMNSSVPCTKSQSPTPDSEEATRMKSMLYKEFIGTLLWVANGTRPVISYAVGTLASLLIIRVRYTGKLSYWF
jgi:Reverse transcriptase (RNA-dependent DNA polymerase)